MKIILECFFLLPILTTLGCVKSSTKKSTAHPTPLVWATPTLPAKQDWTECTNDACTTHASLVMEGLVRADRKETLALAERVVLVAPREIRVLVKRGVLWSDGAELKAKDFVSSWQRSWLKCLKTPATKYFTPILGTEGGCRSKTRNLDGLEVLSDYEFRILLSAPSPFFVRKLAHPLFFPKRAEMPEATLGPFVFVERGNYAPNSKYHSRNKPARGIQFIEVLDEVERIALFLEGSLDIADALSPKSVPLLKNNPSLQPWSTGKKLFLLFDSALPHRIRQALVESLLLSESMELLAFAVEENRALVNEIDPPKMAQGVTISAPLKEKLAGTAMNFQVPKDDTFTAVANYLRAQWQTRLALEVKTSERKRGKLGIELRVWTPDWFDPGLPRFVSPLPPSFANREAALVFWDRIQKDWLEKEFLVAPLFETKQYVLRKPSVGLMERSTLGSWAFDRVAHW
jgi:hypothetical protein